MSFSKKGRFHLKNSKIENTEIDMNNRQITTVGDPTNLGDAVNLRYVNSIVTPNPLSNIYQATVQIISGIPITLSYLTTLGNYTLRIWFINNRSNGPYTEIDLRRDDPNQYASMISIHSRKSVTVEYLKVTWPLNSLITIEKQGGNLFDGNYQLHVTINP